MQTPSKTLVIRFGSIGDVVLATPLLRVLRTRFPDSQIDFLTKKECAELVRSNHNLNYTYEYDSSEGFDGLRALKKRVRDENYDLIVDIHGSLRSRYVRALRSATRVVKVDKRIPERTALVRLKKNVYSGVVSVADRYIETLHEYGVTNDGKGLELHLTDETLFSMNGRMATYGLHRFEKVFGLCPGAKHGTKQWPAERFVALGSELVQRYDGAVVLFGGNSEVELNGGVARGIRKVTGDGRVIDLTGTCTLMESAAAMEYVDVVVTNDTGLMHIAAAKDKPLVALFGSTVREFGFFPVSHSATVLEVDGLGCRPCSHIGLPECPETHFRCMLDQPVESVLRAVQALLKLPS
jgi:heptosyltransferase-2